MAITTKYTFLMKKDSSTYTKLVDIKSFPDLGGSPDMLDKTTLSDAAYTYLLGLQSSDGLQFNCNYDKTDYEKLEALRDREQEYSVWFGGTPGSTADAAPTPTGTDGKFDFKGYLSVYVSGGEVNGVVEMTVVIAPSTRIAMNEE